MRASLVTRRFDLLVLDMPLAIQATAGSGTDNGQDPLRNERNRSGARLPVIVLSAHAHWMDRVIGLEMGADDFVAQPVQPRELVARIRAVLRRVGTAAVPSTGGSGSSSSGLGGAQHACANGRFNTRFCGLTRSPPSASIASPR